MVTLFLQAEWVLGESRSGAGYWKLIGLGLTRTWVRLPFPLLNKSECKAVNSSRPLFPHKLGTVASNSKGLVR